MADGTFRPLIVKTIAIWALITATSILLFLLVSVRETVAVSMVRILGCFATILAYYIVASGKHIEGKRIARVYLLFFSVQIMLGLMPSLRLSPARELYVAQYSNMVYLGALVGLCGYVLMSVIARQETIRVVAAVLIVGTVIGIQFFPYFQYSRYLYTLPDVIDFRIIDRGKSQLIEEGMPHPGVNEIAERVVLSEWDDVRRLGELPLSKERARIRELLPFTEGFNYSALIYKPYHRAHAVVAATCVAILALFFILNYVQNPPSPPHFEKIHGALLVYCILDGVHSVFLSNAATLEEFIALGRIGKYATACVILVFIALFIGRLRFLTKGEGRFYERKLARDPGSVSRWRDSIDEFIIRKFLTSRGLERRFLVRREEKEEARKEAAPEASTVMRQVVP